MKFRPVYFVFSLLFIGAFSFFYYKYVPLVKSFQMILIPILFIMLVLCWKNLENGILFFVFTFPLINNLPYFFGIHGNIPHAPTALVLFLVFFLGWLLHNSFFPIKTRFNHPIFKPMILFSLIVIVSAAITFFRYANFFPFFSDNIRELVVNTNGVRAGGAIMSDVFNSLSYLTGFLFFLILFNTIKSNEFMKRILIVFSISILLTILFSFVQKYYSISLGNTPLWIQIARINSTFVDPNSFGIILASSLPLFFGMALSFRRNFKFFFFLLVLLGIFMFPSIGSRSGFLGLGVSVITFFLLFLASYQKSLKKKIIYISSFFLILVLFFLSFLLISKHSTLSKRIEWSFEVLAKEENLNKLSKQKLDLWLVASNMIKDYPLTGVGAGAFIIELPNYGQLMDFNFRYYTDSAENYMFQVGSELGLIGFFLMFWLFFGIIRQMWKNWKDFPTHKKDEFIFIGAMTGVVSIFVNFFFHSYIGSFEFKYFFWFLIALVLNYSWRNEKSEPKTKWNPKFKLIAVIVILSFGAVHLWNSTHSLSIQNETEKYGFEQNFGLYPLETDDRNFYFNWTKKSAGLAVENIGDIVVIPMMASHPDIQKRPVKVKVYLANHYFRKKIFLKEVIIKNTGLTEFKHKITRQSEKYSYFVFETNRVWQPLKYLGIPDPRWLAIGLGKVWFEYPSELLSENSKDIQTSSSKKWEGKFNNILWINGIGTIKFEVEQKAIALRLHIRGQKAFDIGPYITVSLDNQIIGKTIVAEDSWTTLVFTPEICEGEHILSVEFTNDIRKPELGHDRNVFLGDLEIIYQE